MQRRALPLIVFLEKNLELARASKLGDWSRGLWGEIGGSRESGEQLSRSVFGAVVNNQNFQLASFKRRLRDSPQNGDDRIDFIVRGNDNRQCGRANL
jgi:hypothetical protein